MPDKHLTIASYAAGASLAAITLVYVFAPSFFIDEQSASASASLRKKGVVGLSNPANDCFINSVLQSLASLGDLRFFLIRETHRRTLDNADVYTESSENSTGKSSPSWKIEGLQQGLVTHGLKEILDALNERPLHKKTISAIGFVQVLEKAFRQRISRQQQDAQEFLQVVAERLNDEYHAGHLARQKARARLTNGYSEETPTEKMKSSSSSLHGLRPKPSELPTAEHQEDWTEDPKESPTVENIHADAYADEEGFPLEGTTESQIECLSCGFKPTASATTFCTLIVNVPQVQSTTLSACFDGIFKTENIDDFKCEKCRLVHAVTYYQDLLSRSDSEEFKTSTRETIERLQEAIESDPEDPPKDIELPDSKNAPKRKIARHVRITKFPKVLAIHLSRSIFDYGQSSMKNSAKVAFPERLPVGGLMDRRNYKLLAVTTHKGGHQSGHYETFRRQATFPAFSTPTAINPNGAFKKTAAGSSSSSPSPQIPAVQEEEEEGDLETLERENGDSHTPDTPVFFPPDEAPSPTLSVSSGPSPRDSVAPTEVSQDPSVQSPNPATKGRLSTDSHASTKSGMLKKRFSKISSSSKQRQSSDIPEENRDSAEQTETSSLSSSIRRRLSKVNPRKDKPTTTTTNGTPTINGTSPTIGGKMSNGSAKSMAKEEGKFRRRKKKMDDRWWRISDEKIKESKTAEVLGMQKEVYLLFYELER